MNSLEKPSDAMRSLEKEDKTYIETQTVVMRYDKSRETLSTVIGSLEKEKYYQYNKGRSSGKGKTSLEKLSVLDTFCRKRSARTKSTLLRN